MDDRPTVLLPVVRDPASPAADNPTALLPAVPKEPPVFVDTSGRRRRWLRVGAYGFGVVGLACAVLVGVSFAGGPAGPETVLPFTEPTHAPAPTSSADPNPVVGPATGGSPTLFPGASPSTEPTA